MGEAQRHRGNGRCLRALSLRFTLRCRMCPSCALAQDEVGAGLHCPCRRRAA